MTFNALPNIFDLESRHLKSNLSLVGLDLKKGLSNTFSDDGLLDDILLFLETDKPSEVAVTQVGLTYNAADEGVTRFLQWVLESGTKYNHRYGLLSLSAKELTAQQHRVAQKDLAQK